MTLKPNKNNINLLAKFPWQWVVIVLLGAISTLFGFVIKNQIDNQKIATERIEYLRNYIKTVETEKTEYIQIATAKSDKEILRLQKLNDSLQGLILARTDKSYTELKEILTINNQATKITIKPKRK